MTLEHEAMHVETLLYMLIQCAGSGTLPPTGFITPPWTSLAEGWNTNPAPQTKTVTLGPAIVSLGHDDDEADDDDTRSLVEGYELGWDNEHPKRQVDVGCFKIEWRPVTNGEFYQFYIKVGIRSDKVSFPASWVDDGDTIKVCAFSIKFTCSTTCLLGTHSIWTCPIGDSRELADRHFVRQSFDLCSCERRSSAYRSGTSTLL
jgi:hypothetical protein